MITSAASDKIPSHPAGRSAERPCTPGNTVRRGLRHAVSGSTGSPPTGYTISSSFSGWADLKQSFAIETKNLTKRFGSFTALSELNLKIENGVIHGLLGPNGAGKTTVIKILCGLLKLSGGEAYIFGNKVPNRSILPQIGYMPQETALYLELSVHHNLALYGEVYGMSRGRIAEREKELLQFIALEKWRDEPVSTLSGGMKQDRKSVVE